MEFLTSIARVIAFGVAATYGFLCILTSFDNPELTQTQVILKVLNGR